MGEATESTLKLPNKSVVIALWRASIEASTKAASITAEVRERVQTQSEIGSLNKRAYNMGLAAIKQSINNELAALESIDHGIEYLLWARDEIRSRGHVGDLVQQAEQQPANALPLDQAEKAFEETAHLAPTPAEVDAKAAAKNAAPAPLQEVQGDSVDEFRKTLKGGRGRKKKTDEDVKAVADKHVQAQEERLGAAPAEPALDEGFDDLAPPPAPKTAMPDIPAPLDRRKKNDPLADATGQGSYTLN